jgi:hypothetical protein
MRDALVVAAMRRLAFLAVVLATAAACATPVGVAHEDPRVLYRALTRSVLSSGQPSPFTEQLLRRHGLDTRFQREPEAVLEELRHTQAPRDADRLFALAELSFVHAERAARPDYHLAAAVYAYAFLTSAERRAEVAPAADPRARLAADLYNLGMTRGLTVTPSAQGNGRVASQEEVVLDDRTLPLPFGQLELRGHPEQRVWGGYRMQRFIPLTQYRVRGLHNRYRQPGVGVPLAAEVAPVGEGKDAERARKRIPPRIRVPATAFVALPDVQDGIRSGRLRGVITLHAADEATTVHVEGVTLPLEMDTSGALASMLEGAPVWDTELSGFLRGDRPLFGDGLIMLHPYRRGRVPVILVHGTASSPARWAEIINEVQNDPFLRTRVQLWLFIYNTSNPILLSASRLREALAHVVEDLDPGGTDGALRDMVMAGHSQGGLLARLMVTDSGTRFWANVTDVPFADVRMPAETRALVQRTMFFEPCPYVRRVVFMATPHRGSYRVSGVVLRLVRRLVTLPVTIVREVAELAVENPELEAQGALRNLPTAVDNMRPGHPFIRTLSSSPMAPDVVVHSIVAVEGPGGLPDPSDGVVTYRSAHLEDAASEVVVRSKHSMQRNPDAILEFRRILREHVAAH